jgi:predicted Zn-dependent protease
MPKHVAPRFVMLGTQGTSHRIVAYEEEALPTTTTPQNSPDPATGLILVDRIPGSTKTALSPLVLLQAYQSVLARSPNRTDLKSRHDQLLDRLAKSDPDNVLVLSALAKRELEKRSSQGDSAAVDYLSRAVKLRSKSPQDYMVLGELLYRSGHRVEAINILKRAVFLFPYIPTAYENLAFCYVSIGDGAKAKEIVKDGLSIFPSDAVLQAMRRKVDASETPP